MVTPEYLNWGGVGSYVIQLAKNLPSEYEVHLICLGPKNETISPEVSNIHIHTIGTAKDTFLYNNQFQISLWRSFKDLRSRYGFDILHANHAQMSDLLLKVLGDEIPSLTTVHSTIGSQRLGTKNSEIPISNLEMSEKMTYLLLPFLLTAERMYMHHCSSVIYVSEYIRQWCQRSFGMDCHNKVIHNGIDTDMFHPRDESTCLEKFPELQGVDNIVLFSGRMIALKGIGIAIKACSLMNKDLDAHFVFAGNGSSEQWKRMTRELGISSSRCTFLDPVPYHDMPYLYPLASVFMLPSHSESFPLTLLEAMASGIPVVASSVGGVPEMIDASRDGLLVPPNDPKALCGSISSILRDKGLAGSLSTHAKEKVQKEFSARSMAIRTAEMYKETVEGLI